MTDVQFSSTFSVTLIDKMGSDQRIVQAARVSTIGADSIDSGVSQGLINFLMKNRHGSPFEHAQMTWMISAPIFVWREFMRHRIASYNEESGRYKQLEPKFYLPPANRPAIQTGKPGHYIFETDRALIEMQNELVRSSCQGAYAYYEFMLEKGVAKEVARQHLPLCIFSTAYVTMNLRGLMNFLSLRTHSTAQWEIRQIAFQMEENFAHEFPQVAQAFFMNEKVAP